ncbi:hypothetical protein SAMN04489761_4319 [Tenacibaculum sp. MAR_2009_124]|uniref:hypothetical protein n=1 Tax=Tenacibaculum sp. MAR_2009_124 TaxID=1250059 RepID=UPI00089D5BD8|nr:hypothetical protein [Tenacibaculum sp. MAR_2009_124]SED11460.1 hypothetical protein SAMN04489761_4319 [Tenacibaculum sp. MAR_2009_124]
MKKTKRLEILENSLEKKNKAFNDKLQNHINTVKQANGQPLNDKRNGRATLNKWERQNNSLRNLQESIKKTENAIRKEKNKISESEYIKNILPISIIKKLEDGTLNQWRKHPTTFFVNGVDKARIVWDSKKKTVAHRYLNEIKDKDQWKLFAKTYNHLYNSIKKDN